jgi:hypothetical protein
MAMVLYNKHDCMIRTFWKSFSSGTPSAHELVPPLVEDIFMEISLFG